MARDQDKGCTFEIYLSCSTGLAAATAKKLSDHEGSRGMGAILLVDDDELVRSFGQEVLEQHGYKVLLAEDGEQALKIFSKAHERIAAVVLDLTMPRMSGWEALRRMRLIHPELKVIICSGNDIFDQASDLEDMGPFKALPKPFTPLEMERIIQETLNQE